MCRKTQWQLVGQTLQTCCTSCSSLFAIQAAFHNTQYDAGRRFQMSVPAYLLPKWCAKILRLLGFVSPLKTELEGYLKFCRTGRTIDVEYDM